MPKFLEGLGFYSRKKNIIKERGMKLDTLEVKHCIAREILAAGSHTSSQGSLGRAPRTDVQELQRPRTGGPLSLGSLCSTRGRTCLC